MFDLTCNNLLLFSENEQFCHILELSYDSLSFSRIMVKWGTKSRTMVGVSLRSPMVY
ncbi:hypothetical protein D922_01847 [Enterococcus faecalis 06-MB-DW-09]|nr:hypothetical protein D922_01847 [Enterococcus faecalis 06-MB-DW-09]